MTSYLYKVSAPRASLVFHPRTFWHTRDWESSTTRPRVGYIEDDVLYVGDFDEVSIHLFPRVRIVRIRSADVSAARLRKIGLHCEPGKSTYIFVRTSCRVAVESFRPTIYKFHSDGFNRIRRGEYVSWESRQAVSAETISMGEAITRWNIQVLYVDDLDILVDALRRAGIYFDEQT
jgi:hypothetical protein